MAKLVETFVESIKHYNELCHDTCIGGLRTNHDLEVVDKKEAAIKGLYAAGVCVGNWLGVGYSHYGSESSFTTFSGYTAGENAARFVLKKA